MHYVIFLWGGWLKMKGTVKRKKRKSKKNTHSHTYINLDQNCNRRRKINEKRFKKGR